MNLLLSILLYLSSISTGQTYTWEEIQAISAAQQPSIESIQQNQQQTLQIQQDYGGQASLINVRNIPAGY